MAYSWKNTTALLLYSISGHNSNPLFCITSSAAARPEDAAL